MHPRWAHASSLTSSPASSHCSPHRSPWLQYGLVNMTRLVQYPALSPPANRNISASLLASTVRLGLNHSRHRPTAIRLAAPGHSNTFKVAYVTPRVTLIPPARGHVEPAKRLAWPYDSQHSRCPFDVDDRIPSRR